MNQKGRNEYLYIFLYLALILIAWWSTKNWDTTQTVAIILTGIIIIWYTIETKLLRYETQKQTEIQIKPFIILKIKDGEFILHNIGHGPALNVKIQPVQVSSREEIVIRFEEAFPTLKPDESISIKAQSFRKGKSAGDFFLAHLDPKYANRNLNVVIEYQDINMHAFSTKERISPQKKKIIEFQN